MLARSSLARASRPSTAESTEQFETAEGWLPLPRRLGRQARQATQVGVEGADVYHDIHLVVIRSLASPSVPLVQRPRPVVMRSLSLFQPPNGWMRYRAGRVRGEIPVWAELV